MKNIEMIKAYKALERLKAQKMNIRSAYQLMKLQRKMKAGYDLYAEAEQKLIIDAGLADKMDGNMIHFGQGEEALAAANAFNIAHSELDETEWDGGGWQKARVDDIREIRITMEDIAALEPFVIFEGLETIGEEDAHGDGCGCGNC